MRVARSRRGARKPGITRVAADRDRPVLIVERALTRIKLAENFCAVFYAPFYAAQALALYRREGVDVEMISSSTPGDAVNSLLDGAIDITWGGPMRVMKARDRDPNSPLVCFCEVVGRDPFYLVGGGDPGAFMLADLQRMRFGAVSEVPTPWMCLQHDLRDRGIDPDRVRRAADRPMADNLAALRAGELDVAQLFEPYVSIALNEGAGVLYAAAARGPTVYTTFITVRQAIERHRTAFAGIARALGGTLQWIAEHGADELAEVTAPFFPGVRRAILASALERYRRAGIWSPGSAVSRQGFARLAESLLSGAFISRLPRYEDCVDDTLET
jgi:NitT/TauT family transport system substrate-binding protein